MAAAPYFTAETFAFLRDLAANNDRDWFAEHKARYEEHVKDPALRFIVDVGPELHEISPHFRADPRANGGSLFRIYRDTRFSNDKAPYKTQTGIQFRHEAGKSAHAPGFYLHVDPDEIFIGVGTWRPDFPSIRKIREAIVDDPDGWLGVRDDETFQQWYSLAGQSLVRAPRGFDAEHPLIEDLRRKDFIAACSLTRTQVTDPAFRSTFLARCRAAGPFQRWLCAAVGVEY